MLASEVLTAILEGIDELPKVVRLRGVSKVFCDIIGSLPIWEAYREKYSTTVCDTLNERKFVYEYFEYCLNRNCVCVAEECYPEYFVAKAIQADSPTPALNYLIKQFKIDLKALPDRFITIAFKKGTYAMKLFGRPKTSYYENVELFKAIPPNDFSFHYMYAVSAANYEVFDYLIKNHPSNEMIPRIITLRDIRMLEAVCAHIFIGDINFEVADMIIEGDDYRSSPGDFFDVCMKLDILPVGVKFAVACALERDVEQMVYMMKPRDKALAAQVISDQETFNIVCDGKAPKKADELMYMIDNVWMFEKTHPKCTAKHARLAVDNNAAKILRYALSNLGPSNIGPNDKLLSRLANNDVNDAICRVLIEAMGVNSSFLPRWGYIVSLETFRFALTKITSATALRIVENGICKVPAKMSRRCYELRSLIKVREKEIM